MLIFRALIFWPLLAVIAALIILASLGPRAFLQEPGAAREGTLTPSGALQFGPADLAETIAGDDHELYVVMDERGPIGLRVATAAKAGAASPQRRGALLRLGPQAQQFIARGPVEIRLQMQPVRVTAAPRISVGLVAPDGTLWSEAEALDEPGLVTLRYAETVAAEAISFWPTNRDDDFAYGVEIVGLEIRPAAPEEKSRPKPSRPKSSGPASAIP